MLLGMAGSGRAVGAGAVPAGAERTAAAANAEISVFYVGGALQVKVGGAVVRSGGSIPAGPYAVVVYDDEVPLPQFSLTGAGISVYTEMNSTDMGGLITPWPM